MNIKKLRKIEAKMNDSLVDMTDEQALYIAALFKTASRLPESVIVLNSIVKHLCKEVHPRYHILEIGEALKEEEFQFFLSEIMGNISAKREISVNPTNTK